MESEGQARASAPNGSIRRLAAPRGDLLTFEIRGKIPSADMHWMTEEVEKAFSTSEEIDMLLIMRGFEGAGVGALFDPTVIKVQLRSLGKVRRYAVVGAPAFARAIIEAFDLVVPVDAKTFGIDEEEAARLWVDGRGETAEGG